MDLHADELIIFQGRPSWRSTLNFYLVGLVVAVLAGIVAGLIGSTGTGIGIGAAIFLVVLVVGFLRRLGTHYALTNERLHIRRGLLARHIQETRLDRVQNVNTNQTVLQRALGIGTVDFDTSGSGDSDFSFTGVAHPAKVVADVDRALRAASQGGGVRAPAPLDEPPLSPETPPAG